MAEVDVHLWAGLKRLTGGVEIVTVEASTIGEMLQAVIRAYPALEPVIDAGVSVALNGEIYNGGRHREVAAGDEIFLLQKIKGG